MDVSIASPDVVRPAQLKQSLPLFGHAAVDQVIAWRNDEAVNAATFLRDIYALIPLLPSGTHILNDCRDRYRFSVVLCAAMVAGKINLLPSTRTAETIHQLQLFAPDVACVTDQQDCTIALPQTLFPSDRILQDSLQNSAECPFVVPQIDTSQIVAYVFTSGSTGLPIGHCKTWGSLISNVQTEALQFGLLPSHSYQVVGTVPAQHMFGFESTVLMPLVNGFSFSSARSFYPADICQSLTQVPEPRILITTPIHLRSLLGAQLALPKLALIVSATAPLSPQLASEVEQAFETPVYEIYGSTETGQIASRRPTESPEWALFPTLTMQPADEGLVGNTENGDHQRMWISGGHVEPPMPMNDVLEITSKGHFLLHGRISDLINIAGKRSSLAYLNHHLNAIAGVQDGTFYMPPEKSNGEVTRLQAVVVAPDLTNAQIIAALREKIDPAFMPRPLYQVAQLPRNATGKLPQSVLNDLMRTLATGDSKDYRNGNTR